MNRARTAITLVPVLFFLVSCGPKEQTSEENDSTATASSSTTSYILTPAHYDTLSKNPAPLANGRSSIDSLLAAALDGIRQNDTATLKSLLITREEYLNIIYPELGKHWSGARDMRPEISDVLWTNHAGNSMKGLRRALRDLGGRDLKLEKVEFADGEKEYVSYVTHEGTVLTVKDGKGKNYRIGAIGSIVEKDGVFKLLSYREQEPK